MNISSYMSKDLIYYLAPKSRDLILLELIAEVKKQGKIVDDEAFFNVIIERESVISTGIGMGVALPHAKLSFYNEFFIAIGIIKGAVDWNSLDGTPVRLVFMIGGPDDKHTDYLQLLSGLTQKIKDEERRQKLLTLQDPNAILELFA